MLYDNTYMYITYISPIVSVDKFLKVEFLGEKVKALIDFAILQKQVTPFYSQHSNVCV